ncbi:MAG: FkbM family methyltransferase [bacterium]
MARILPAPAAIWIKKLYYPHLIRNFPEQRWPGAEIVRRLVRAGDCVVDAGANIGYVTALLSRWVGPAGFVHAFEPVPETFDLLQHNIRATRLRNVVAHACALSSDSGHAHMDIPQYSGGGSNLYESRIAGAGERPAGAVRVETKRLDAFSAEWGRPVSCIKIDVEGHELDVLRGSKSTLERDHPALYIEVSGDPDDPSSSASELVQFLSEYGYAVHIHADGVLRPRRVGDTSTDYFFLTKQHLELLCGSRAPGPRHFRKGLFR